VARSGPAFVSELEELRRENATLRLQMGKLQQQLAEAQLAIEALARGEVDAVTFVASSTPLLLHAAQERLRRSEELLRAVFDGSLDAKLLADDSGRYVDANPAACELFGVPRERLIGRSLLEFAAPGYDAEPSGRALREGGRVRGQFPLQRPDGTQRVLDYSAVAHVMPGLHLSVLKDVTDRVAAEDALRANRALLEEAQAIAHIGSWTSGVGSDQEIKWSPECYRIFGVAAGAPMTVASFLALVHPEDREGLSQLSRDATERSSMFDLEHRVQRPDGQLRWVHERAIVERDSAGCPTRMVGTVQDVTDRHLAVEALRTSEAEFRLLAEAMPQIVWITRPDGGNVYFNQRWMDYTGLTFKQSLEHGWNEPFHPEDKQLAFEAWQRATATIGPYSLECRLRRLDGVYRWWLIRGVPVRDASGNIVKWFGTCTDIDDLKQSESRLRENEALLRIAGHAARLGAWSVVLAGSRVTWSDEVCAIHEVPPGTIPDLEQTIAFYAPEFRATISEKFAACARDGTSFDLELQIVTNSGRRVWVRTIGDAERDSSGAITTVRGAFQDIDDRHRLQEQLRQAQKMEAVGQLAGGVAHDFNNILAIILSYGSFIRDALERGDPRRDDIIQVLKAGERAAGLTRQLLAFSRQQPTEKRPTDLNQSLAQLHKLLSRTLGEHVELRVIPSARSAVVKIDPVQFDQIVLNLAVNARDAMPNGGLLCIALEQPTQPALEQTEPGWVHLKVIDTGTGMDDQTQQHIFEPFFTTKEKGKGTGLGLATCFGIVSDAGGTIQVESAPGRGTTFTVELPLCSEAADVAPALGNVERLGQGEVVLVAEDDAALRKVAARILGSAGYRVHLASDGTEAIEKLDELAECLDVLLSDVVMPGCGGYDVVEHAARVAPGAVLLLTSGFLDEPAKRNQRKDVPILWKPVPPRELVRAVGDALSRRALSRTEPVAAGGGVVLVVEADAAARNAMVRMLAAAGYASKVAATVAEAQRALEIGPEPQLVLCDLTFPDGAGAALLDWIQSTRPALCSRVFVLTDGALDAAGRRVTKSGIFRILVKPIAPQLLLDILAGAARMSPPPSVPLSPLKFLRQVSHDLNAPISTLTTEVFSARQLLGKLRSGSFGTSESSRALSALEEICANVEHASSGLTECVAAISAFGADFANSPHTPPSGR
jgi:PAS domain S-box-containing protein